MKKITIKNSIFLKVIGLILVASALISCEAKNVQTKNTTKSPLIQCKKLYSVSGELKLLLDGFNPRSGLNNTEYYVLELDEAKDLKGDKNSLTCQEDVGKVTEMHLILGEKSMNPAPFVNRKVVAYGEVDVAHTGHHQRQVIMFVTNLAPL